MCKVTPDFVEHRQPGVVAPGADWLSHLTEADILYQLIFISVLRYHTHTQNMAPGRLVRSVSRHGQFDRQQRFVPQFKKKKKKKSSSILKELTLQKTTLCVYIYMFCICVRPDFQDFI